MRVFFSVEAAYVCRGQRLQLHVTESGGDVFVGDVGVVSVSRLFDGALYVICKPTVQVLADRELPGVVEEAAVSVRQIARRLSRSSLLILAGGNSRIVRSWGADHKKCVDDHEERTPPRKIRRRFHEHKHTSLVLSAGESS